MAADALKSAKLNYMEIELKLVVPSRQVFDQLLALVNINDYKLIESGSRTVIDSYRDTTDGNLRAAGFACRIRHDVSRGTWIATLKGLGIAVEGVHKREELEASILPNARPSNWPIGPARNLVNQLSQGRPLVELFTIRQIRHVKRVERNEVTVAELSLDEVWFASTPDGSPVWELELELEKSGVPSDLEALHEGLSQFGLEPQTVSKFEHEMARTGAGAIRQG